MKTLNVLIITIALLIAVPVFAEIEPDYGTRVEITFDDSGVDYNNADYKIDPAISPDGKWIAFSTGIIKSSYTPYSNREAIWLVPAEGGEAKLLYHDRPFLHCLRFTPDSKTLAFQHSISTSDDTVPQTKTLYG
ncbi:MAG TPA: hypothetical protein ENH82_03090, partial [bacterium]|nr:hypothetical protein [bacterium]